MISLQIQAIFVFVINSFLSCGGSKRQAKLNTEIFLYLRKGYNTALLEIDKERSKQEGCRYLTGADYADNNVTTTTTAITTTTYSQQTW